MSLPVDYKRQVEISRQGPSTRTTLDGLLRGKITIMLKSNEFSKPF